MHKPAVARGSQGDDMDFQQLEVLEEKIKKMLVNMRALQAENDVLKRRQDESQKAIQKLKNDQENWSRSLQENESLHQQIQQLSQERDEIRGKLERLIGQLDELEAKL